MKKIKYILIILIIPLLGGCYNYRELNDLGIVTAISIDYEDNVFKVNSQVINPVKSQDAQSSGEPTFVNFASEGKSLQEAFRLVILDSPRQLYASQLQLLIISEEVATNHLEEVLDFFIRDPEIRAEFKVIIAKDKEDLKGISIQTILDNLSSSNILESLEIQAKKEGITLDLTINDLANMYLNPYQEIILPSMIVEGNIKEGEGRENVTNTEAQATTKIAPSIIFKGNEIVGHLTTQESKNVGLIRGEMKSTIITMDYQDGYITFEPNRLKTKVEANPKENKVTINIQGFARISEVAAHTNIKSPKEIDTIEKTLNNYIQTEVTNTFQNIREEYNTDIFGFRDTYYKTDHKYFKKNCTNWYEDIFPNTKVEVKSNIKLYEKGNSLGGIEYERENK